MSSYYGPSRGGGRDRDRDRRRDDYHRGSSSGGSGQYGRRDDRRDDRRDRDRDRDRDRGGGSGGGDRGGYRGGNGSDRDSYRSGGGGGYRGGGDRDYNRGGSGGGYDRRDRGGSGGGDRGYYGRRDDRDRGGGGGGYGDQGGDRGEYGGGRGGDRGSDRGGYGGGRGGDRDRGGGRGSGGGRGRGRGRGGPPMPNPTEALSNLIPAKVTPYFQFYQYGLDGSNIEGKLIDSRRRKSELLNVGLFDEKQGLLARNGMSTKDMESLRRVIFFEGSFMFTAFKIPFLEKFPYSLVGSKDKDVSASNLNVPIMDNGDCMTITGVSIMSKPDVLKDESHEEARKTASKDSNALVVDRRCSNCPTSFKSLDALINHCTTTGHSPVHDEAGAQPSNVELFTSFCNVALQRAMGERMARWGKEYIDPKSWAEPKDKQGRSLGVRIFRAYVSNL